MSIKASWIVNTGPFQHVEVTIESDTIAQFEANLVAFDDALKAKLGLFQAELESWVIPARQNALEGVHQDGVHTITSLGATVIDEIPASVGEEMPGDVAHSAAVQRPWQRKQEESKPKAWEPKKPAALDDF